ncbi:MAG: transcriptional regulator [Anaerolineae bacterium]|nr:transcriptional regulator [Anaerolineae bacterium]
MPNQQVIELRKRVLGVLLRRARERVRASRSACAEVLGVSGRRFAGYEDGSGDISLPELELLCSYLDVSLQALRDERAELDDRPALPDPEMFLPLRHRIIGARLRQARHDAGRTQSDLADLVEHSTSTISAYEYGEKPVPMAELELVARALGVPLDAFLDQESPVGEWHALKAQFTRFAELPAELREFVVRPINMSYLELAMKLAEMPAGALRTIAEGLLEITY